MDKKISFKKGSEEYTKLETILSKIANDNNLIDIQDIKVALTKDKGVLKYNKEAEISKLLNPLAATIGAPGWMLAKLVNWVGNGNTQAEIENLVSTFFTDPNEQAQYIAKINEVFQTGVQQMQAEQAAEAKKNMQNQLRPQVVKPANNAANNKLQSNFQYNPVGTGVGTGTQMFYNQKAPTASFYSNRSKLAENTAQQPGASITHQMHDTIGAAGNTILNGIKDLINKPDLNEMVDRTVTQFFNENQIDDKYKQQFVQGIKDALASGVQVEEAPKDDPNNPDLGDENTLDTFGSETGGTPTGTPTEEQTDAQKKIFQQQNLATKGTPTEEQTDAQKKIFQQQNLATNTQNFQNQNQAAVENQEGAKFKQTGQSDPQRPGNILVTDDQGQYHTYNPQTKQSYPWDKGGVQNMATAPVSTGTEQSAYTPQVGEAASPEQAAAPLTK